MQLGTAKIRAFHKKLVAVLKEKDLSKLTPEVQQLGHDFFDSVSQRMDELFKSGGKPIFVLHIYLLKIIWGSLFALLKARQQENSQLRKEEKNKSSSKRKDTTTRSSSLETIEHGIQEHLESLLSSIVSIEGLFNSKNLVQDFEQTQHSFKMINQYFCLMQILTNELTSAFPNLAKKIKTPRDVLELWYTPNINEHLVLDPIVHPVRLCLAVSPKEMSAYHELLTKKGHLAIILNDRLWVQVNEYTQDIVPDKGTAEFIMAHFLKTFAHDPKKQIWIVENIITSAWTVITKGLTPEELQSLRTQWYGNNSTEAKADVNANLVYRPIVTFQNSATLHLQTESEFKTISPEEAKAVLGLPEPWSESTLVHKDLIPRLRKEYFAKVKSMALLTVANLREIQAVRAGMYQAEDFIIRQQAGVLPDAVFNPQSDKPQIVTKDNPVTFSANIYHSNNNGLVTTAATNITQFFRSAPVKQAEPESDYLSLDDIHFVDPAIRARAQAATIIPTALHFKEFTCLYDVALTKLKKGTALCRPLSKNLTQEGAPFPLLRDKDTGQTIPPYRIDAVTGKKIPGYYLKTMIMEYPDGQIEEYVRDDLLNESVPFFYAGDPKRKYRYLWSKEELDEILVLNAMTLQVKVNPRVLFPTYIAGKNISDTPEQKLEELAKKVHQNTGVDLDFLRTFARSSNQLFSNAARGNVMSLEIPLPAVNGDEQSCTITPDVKADGIISSATLKTKVDGIDTSFKSSKKLREKILGVHEPANFTEPTFRYFEQEERLWCVISTTEEKQLNQLAEKLTKGGIKVLCGVSGDIEHYPMFVIDQTATPQLLHILKTLLPAKMYQTIVELLPEMCEVSAADSSDVAVVSSSSSPTSNFADYPGAAGRTSAAVSVTMSQSTLSSISSSVSLPLDVVTPTVGRQEVTTARTEAESLGTTVVKPVVSLTLKRS